MDEPLPHVIEPARDVDLAFIRDSWRRSYRRSPETVRMPGDLYVGRHNERMDRVMAASQTLVARPVDWPDGIIGWATADVDDREIRLHYVFVKRAYREHGIGNALVAAFGTRPTIRATCARPPYCRHIKLRGSNGR